MTSSSSCDDVVNVADSILSGSVSSISRLQGSSFAIALDAYNADKIARAVEVQRMKPHIALSHSLGNAEWEQVQEMYPEYVIERKDTANGNHGLAANLRKLELDVIMSKIGGHGDIVDIGGNPVQHVMSDRLVHCCQPVLDARDGARIAKQRLELKSITSPSALARLDRSSMAYKCRSLFAASVGSEQYVCHKKGEECTSHADVCMFLHSTYDIPFDNLPKVLDSHGSTMGIGVFLFPVNSLVTKKGDSTSHGFSYEVDIDNNEIRYNFKNDSSFSYAHNLRNMSAYMKRSYSVYKGIVYTFEIFSVRGDAMFFEVVKTGGAFRPMPISHRLWCNSIKNSRIVTVPRLVDVHGPVVIENIVLKRILVPVQLVETISGWMASGDVTSMNQLMTYARSANRRIVINGTTVSVPESISVEDLGLLCQVLMVIDEFSKARSSKEVMVARNLMVPGAMKSIIGDSLIERKLLRHSLLYSGLLKLKHGVMSFFEKKTLYEVYQPKIEAAIDYVQFDDYIPGSAGMLSEEPSTDYQDIIKLESVERSNIVSDTDNLSDRDVCVLDSSDTQSSGHSDRELDNASILEYVETLKLEELGVASTYRQVYGTIVPTGRMSNEVASSSENYWLGYKDDAKGMSRCCYNGDIVPLETAPSNVELLFGRSLAYPSNNVKIAAAELALTLPGVKERHVVQGVAGCGKTYRIVNQAMVGSLVASPLKDSVMELKKEKNLMAKTGGRGIRTHDSIIFAGAILSYNHVYLDESSTIHEGANVVVERLSGASVSYRFGDENQVSAINSTVVMWRHNEPAWKTDYEFIGVTRRCPADAAAMMTDWYKKPVTTNVPVCAGYKVQHINSVKDIVKQRDTIYLAMYRDEVRQLREHLASPGEHCDDWINTTHSFQGKTYSNVVIVRLMPHSKDLYESMNYINVALTRHRVSCTYATVLPMDTIAGVIQRAVKNVNGDVSRYMTADAMCAYRGESVKEVRRTITEAYVEQSRLTPVEGVAFFEDDSTDNSSTSYEPVDRIARINGMPDENSRECVGFVKPLDEMKVYDVRCSPVVSNPHIAMQMAYDEVLPWLSLSDNTFDRSSVHYRDLVMQIHGSAKFGDDINPPKIDGAYHKPMLRTAMPLDAANTLTECLLAYNKRNANVPNVTVPVDVESLHDEMWKRGCDNLMIPGYARKLCTYRRDRIEITKSTLCAWWKNQEEVKRKAVIASLDSGNMVLDETPMDKLNMLIKDKRKPMMSAKALREYPASQTLTFSEKTVNCFYGGVMSIMHDRLSKLLKPCVVMATDKSDVNLTRIMNTHMKGGSHDYLEIDISKFDKSQLHVMLEFEMYVYNKLGLDNLVGMLYSGIYGGVQVDNFKTGLRFYLDAQRKSGAPTTLLGNTIVNMFAVNYALNVKKFDLAMFKGDDSILVNPGDGDYNYQLLESHCNFDAKPIMTKNGYFCSSYLVKNSEGQYVLAPDPIKRIEQLGHKNTKTVEQLYERFISMGDLMRHYQDPCVRDNLATAVQKRLKKESLSLPAAIDALASVSSNFNEFKKIWGPLEVVRN